MPRTDFSISTRSLFRSFPNLKILLEPSNDNGIDVNESGILWTFGSWVEIVAANVITEDFFVLGLYIETQSSDSVYHQIGKGGAGSESPIGAIKSGFYPTTAGPLIVPVPIKVSANTRIAVRIATNRGVTANDKSVLGLVYAVGL